MPARISPALAADYVVTVVVVAAAVRCDLKEGRIPNIVSAMAVVAGLAIALIPGGWAGGWQAGLGFIAAFVPFFLLFCVGIVGAGDAKLMAAVGCLVGYPAVLWAMVATALAGGALALAQMAREGRLLECFKNMGLVFAGLIPPLSKRLPKATLTVRIPYSIAIAIGTIVAFGVRDGWLPGI